LQSSLFHPQNLYNAHLPDIDYTINENDTVYEAVQKFAAYNVGCLVTVDAEGMH